MNNYYTDNACYGNPYGFYTGDPTFRLRQSAEKRQLRFLSICAGLALLGFVFFQNVLSVILMLSGGYDLYYNDYLFQNSIGIFMSLICILVPFLCVLKLQKKRIPHLEYLPLSKPAKPSLIPLAVPIGLAVCILGSYASSIFASYVEAVGFELTAPPIDAPTDTLGTVVYFLRVSLTAALTEEIALRGVILQPLRKYGSWFAVLCSSLVFGIMHCNLIQAPFAFFAGVALGYFAIATESLWAPIAIHLLNNLFSLVVESASKSMSDAVYVRFYYACLIVIAVAAVVCIPLFFKARGTLALPKGDTVLTKKQRAGAYIFTVPMVLAILIMLWMTSEFVSLGG